MFSNDRFDKFAVIFIDVFALGKYNANIYFLDLNSWICMKLKMFKRVPPGFFSDGIERRHLQAAVFPADLILTSIAT